MVRALEEYYAIDALSGNARVEGTHPEVQAAAPVPKLTFRPAALENVLMLA